MNFNIKEQYPLTETVKNLRVPSDLPCPSLRDAVDDFEEAYIRRVLHLHRGRKGKTAKTLGIDRKTLYLKMKKHNLISLRNI